MQPAFEKMVPALFGAMAYKYYRKNMKIAALPLIPHEPVVHPGTVPDRLHQLYASFRPVAIAIGVAYDVPEKEYAEPGKKSLIPTGQIPGMNSQEGYERKR